MSLTTLGLAASLSPATAQILPPSPRGFQPLAYEEKWDDPSTAGISASLKDIRIDPAGSVRLDIGGGLREKGEAYRNEVFDLPAARGVPRDAYLLHRFQVHANLRVGTSVRLFAQFENAEQTGRSPTAVLTDRNRADAAQVFAELTVPLKPGLAVGLRGGRQEMRLGSGRLVDIREGPNVRQRFDGLRGWLTVGETRLDLFWTRPVENRPGSFDDRSDPHQQFFGGYVATPFRPIAGATIGAYAYRLRRRASTIDAGTADERRDTYALRLSRKSGSFDFDFEGVRQTGRFGPRSVDAYAIFSDTGVTFSRAPMKPRLALKADVLSGGDSRGSDDLGTFNPLFPKLNYLNEAGIQTLTNLAHLFPYATIQPAPKLAVLAGIDVQWRENPNDAFYRASGMPIVPGNANRRRFLGEALLAHVEWQATQNLNVNVFAVHYLTEGFLQAAGARDQSWIGVWGTFRF